MMFMKIGIIIDIIVGYCVDVEAGGKASTWLSGVTFALLCSIKHSEHVFRVSFFMDKKCIEYKPNLQHEIIAHLTIIVKVSTDFLKQSF